MSCFIQSRMRGCQISQRERDRERERGRERERERERDRERESHNRKQKLTARFRNDTDEAYKVKRLCIILIIV